MFVFWSVMLSMLCCCHKMCRTVCAVTTLSAVYDEEVAAVAGLLTGCFYHASIASSSGELLKLQPQWLQKARRQCLDAWRRPVGVLWPAHDLQRTTAAVDWGDVMGGGGLAAAFNGNVTVCPGTVGNSELVASSFDRAVTANPPSRRLCPSLGSLTSRKRQC